jgi:hypothetical protein
MNARPPDVITDDLILAALHRAECHRGSQDAPDWAVQAHLSISARSRKGREVKSRLPELAQAGYLETGRKYGIEQWSLSAKGRKRLSEVPEAMASLPESPQHRKWRDARDAAEHNVEAFYLSFRDSVDAAADLLSEPMPPCPSSDAWLEVGGRLHRDCRRLASATYCLHECAEPPEDKADPDERTDPSDEHYSPDERKLREARRAGRRNPLSLWWHDSQNTL